ncbi:MAG TPA: hypothetical protein VHM91_06070, partial [Verrucomicrobiales bacterium]|nr:hypothetical protein [Verrucomicrobiales bacterium]
GETLIKTGSNLQVDAGSSVYIKAGMTVIIEAGAQISLKAGGSFIDIGPAGVSISGAMVLINSGGAAGSGTPVSKKSPQEPAVAKKAKSSSAGQVEKSKGAGYASSPQTWNKVTVSDKAAESGAPFYSPEAGATGGGSGGPASGGSAPPESGTTGGGSGGSGGY